MLKPHNQYVLEVKKIHPNLEVIEEYKGRHKNILHKCILDDYVWRPRPSHILEGHGCPVCSGRAIGTAPEYKNSIWASEHKEFFSQYLNKEQMQSNFPNSHIKIESRCPDCGFIKKISPGQLKHSGFGCICGDGTSYPNKFMTKLFEQLQIDIIPEKMFKWSQRRLYDIYIPSFCCIVENHGIQHYQDGLFSKMGGRTLKEEQNNDILKHNLAKQNGIKHYVVIDCRASNVNHIKQSVLESGLFKIINAKEEDIDWKMCAEFASSNLVKMVAVMWNEGCGLSDIRDKYRLDWATIVKYLRQAKEIGWCDYTQEESRKRGQKYKQDHPEKYNHNQHKRKKQ